MLIKENLGVTWLLPSGTRSEAMDAEVVRNLKRSGCLTLNFAPESGSPRMLERIKKQVNLEKMLVSVRACAREGVYVRANIIFGMPGDTPYDMLLTMRFIVRLAWAGMHDIGVFPFAPYPGSALHDLLRARHAFPPEGPEYDRMLLANGTNDYWNPRSWNESHLRAGSCGCCSSAGRRSSISANTPCGPGARWNRSAAWPRAVPSRSSSASSPTAWGASVSCSGARSLSPRPPRLRCPN